MPNKKILKEDLEKALGKIYSSALPIPDISYYEFDQEEQRSEINNIRDYVKLNQAKLVRSGPNRETAWGEFWNDTLKTFEESNDTILLEPAYIKAHSIYRLSGNYVAASGDFERKLYEYIRQSIIIKLLSGFTTIHDLGAGSCFNSLAFSKSLPESNIVAYDWAPATVKIADILAQKHNLNITGSLYNFYQSNLKFDSNDLVITACALEQLGDNWISFLNNMLTAKPKRVVHLEPIYERYNSLSEFDIIAREYHKLRNYLIGYYPMLKKLEQEDKIRIICDHRTEIGSRFHECYTILAWEPK